MLNYIWAAMIAIGILYAALTGNMEAVANGALDSAGEAVDLCITMFGVMGFWVGLMEIAQKSGLVAKMTRGIDPFVSFLFPRIPKDHVAREYISTNIIANVLGLGWACTPAGLKAMQALRQLSEETCEKNRRLAGTRSAKEARGKTGLDPNVASNEMCTFLILNISSLQLIPVTMIAYRSQYGSASPTAIVGPAILATAVSTAVAVVFCKMMDKKKCRDKINRRIPERRKTVRYPAFLKIPE